ncbi:glycosyltransferase involved in cell wall biosynthesis [Rhodoblastus acidophilus]|uniref:glycosyltransferase n=1 Tax=Rhodoblastus acidophilus TaxID=1074 RepID=UPI002224AB4F|nr:glycosyltransferase [Rhodoblastus acidophilus]MCW2316713.1 glycosyltransferase involved in cell wall biosynthesis [Rhodoblastus acidophilus]
MAPDVELVVIVPAFKQPGLLVEAVDSVLNQDAGFPIAALIVDDGCPLPETRVLGLALARAHPGKVITLRRRNGGLSAARNFGLAHAPRLFPHYRAAFFLDADNRLAPGALRKMAAQLDAAEPEIGWVYPDIDTFGQAESFSVAGDYSALAHLRENFCEAGSLVARRVIDAGVRFDESMRDGFEDWDFWLQAARKGFRGLHARDCGFQYRRRAESMLSGAERRRAAILADMRDKHAPLFQARSLIRLEEREAPRFAKFEPGATGVELFVDPRRRQSLDLAEANRRLARARRAPHQAWFPDLFVFAAPGALERLAEARLDRAALWRAQRLLQTCALVAVRFEADAKRLGLTAAEAAGPDALDGAALLIARADDALDPSRAASSAGLADLFRDSGAELVCRGPDLSVAADGLLAFAVDVVEDLAQAQRAFSPQKSDWRREWRRTRRDIRATYSLIEPVGPVLPHVAPEGAERARPQVGFILPLVAFGGVEKVVLNAARAVRDAGCDAHLFVMRENEAALAGELREIFDTVAFMDHPGARADAWDRIYQTAGASNCARDDFIPDGLGLLATMDVVLNTHSLAAHSLMAGLRRQGARAYVGLHLVELSPQGHPMGGPHVALGFEHVYDGFLVVSQQLRAWCVARGIPADKILLARNAPSYPTEAEALARALARRARRPRGRLRALYIGRLDPQKGVDRLEEIMAETEGAPLDWRVIGRAVLDESTALEARLARRMGRPVEAPLDAPAELDAAYAWADVVVLPSRFEGAPLTILEAQRFGCAPIATRVGAVEEMIEDGVDGFLIAETSDARVVEDFAARLRELAGAPQRLETLARAAAARQAQASWSANLRDWLAHALPPADAPAPDAPSTGERIHA